MKSVEFKEFTALLMLFSSHIRVVRADKLFSQLRKKCSVFLVSRVHEHNGFTVSAKLCLKLCSRKCLKPKRNILINLTLNGSQIPYVLFRTNQKLFAQNIVRIIVLNIRVQFIPFINIKR